MCVLRHGARTLGTVSFFTFSCVQAFNEYLRSVAKKAIATDQVKTVLTSIPISPHQKIKAEEFDFTGVAAV